MICQQCGQEAEPDAKFCVDCGSPLVLRCPACQTPYDLGSRFCSLCGRSLPDRIATEPDVPLTEERLSKNPSGPKQAEQPTDTWQPTQPLPHSLSCPRCHQKNTPDADYCFSCGMPLDDSPVEASPSGATVASFTESTAGFWTRLVAFTVDNLLATFIAAMAFALFADADESVATTIGMLLYLGYFTASVGAKSTTIGKSFLGLYVVRSNYSRVGYVRAFFRALSILVTFAVAWGTVLGSIVLIFYYLKNKHTVHDRICNTIVIKSNRHPF